jgi:triosephosphate isomerase (TIM)
MKARTKLVIGNWKMNPATLVEAKRMFATFKKQRRIDTGVTTVICPPTPFIESLKKSYTGNKVFFGAQDVSFQPAGSHTGEVSTGMIQSVGARFVIVGHSERRARGESDEIVTEKARAALTAGLHTILCIGETTRDSQGNYLRILKEQINNSLQSITKPMLKNLILAYEPVWAIGEGQQAMTTHDLHQMLLFIKKHLIEHYGRVAGEAISVIYGGSVDDTNAHAIVYDSGVDGLLVGRSSLNPHIFSKIISEVARKPKK